MRKVHSIPKHATQTSKSMSVNNSCVRVNDKARLEHNCYCKPYLAIAKQANDSQRKQSDRVWKANPEKEQVSPKAMIQSCNKSSTCS